MLTSTSIIFCWFKLCLGPLTMDTYTDVSFQISIYFYYVAACQSNIYGTGFCILLRSTHSEESRMEWLINSLELTEPLLCNNPVCCSTDTATKKRWQYPLSMNTSLLVTLRSTLPSTLPPYFLDRVFSLIDRLLVVELLPAKQTEWLHDIHSRLTQQSTPTTVRLESIWNAKSTQALFYAYFLKNPNPSIQKHNLPNCIIYVCVLQKGKRCEF